MEFFRWLGGASFIRLFLMKSIYKFLLEFSVVFLLIQSAQADIAGSWRGWGEWSFDGSGARCSNVHFVFDETEEELIRRSGQLDCEYVGMEEYPLTLQKSGESLLLNGVVVGKFDANHYQWTEKYSERVTIEVSIIRTGSHIDYTENWFDKETGPLYEIHARLFGRP